MAQFRAPAVVARPVRHLGTVLCTGSASRERPVARYTPMGRSRLAAMKGFLFCCCQDSSRFAPADRLVVDMDRPLLPGAHASSGLVSLSPLALEKEYAPDLLTPWRLYSDTLKHTHRF